MKSFSNYPCFLRFRICIALLFCCFLPGAAAAVGPVLAQGNPSALPAWSGFWQEMEPFCYSACLGEDGLNLESPNQNILFKLGGRLQVDAGDIWANDELQTAFPGIDGADALVRRLRVMLFAALYNRLDLKLEFDFADVPTLTDGYFEFKKLPHGGRLRVGHFKEPFSLEELTSSNSITFMERSLPTLAFAPERNLGVQLHNSFFAERFAAAFGVFMDVGALDTRTSFENAVENAGGCDLTARVTALPWFADDGKKLLHLGLDYSHKFRRNATIQFAARPESHLTQAKLVSTGKVAADNVDLLASELALVAGPVSLQSEFLQAFTSGAGSYFFWGYYAYLSYFLTGESRPYTKSQGIFAAPRPHRDFNPLRGGWGAWELVLRHSCLDLVDGAVEGGKENNFSAGLNWYLNYNVCLMFNYIHAKVTDRASPEVNDGIANIVQGRFQIFF